VPRFTSQSRPRLRVRLVAIQRPPRRFNARLGETRADEASAVPAFGASVSRPGVQSRVVVRATRFRRVRSRAFALQFRPRRIQSDLPGYESSCSADNWRLEPDNPAFSLTFRLRPHSKSCGPRRSCLCARQSGSCGLQIGIVGYRIQFLATQIQLERYESAIGGERAGFQRSSCSVPRRFHLVRFRSSLTCHIPQPIGAVEVTDAIVQ
jgi:hypothetical protein